MGSGITWYNSDHDPVLGWQCSNYGKERLGDLGISVFLPIDGRAVGAVEGASERPVCTVFTHVRHSPAYSWLRAASTQENLRASRGS